MFLLATMGKHLPHYQKTKQFVFGMLVMENARKSFRY